LKKDEGGVEVGKRHGERGLMKAVTVLDHLLLLGYETGRRRRRRRETDG